MSILIDWIAVLFLDEQASHAKIGTERSVYVQLASAILQCWTKGQSFTAVAEDFRRTATATVAEV